VTYAIRAMLLSLLLCLMAVFSIAQQPTQSDEPPTARVSLTIVREENGKPVRNAEVVLHVLDKSGNEKQEGLELKTHEDGKAETDGIPYGKVRIQVIARGFRTYGQDYAIKDPGMEITIKLQKPKPQLSIYK
jgi:hypothetical protein